MTDPRDLPPPDRTPGWVWLAAVVVVSLVLWTMIIWGGVALYRRIVGAGSGNAVATIVIEPVD